MSRDAKVVWNISVAADSQSVVGWIVIGETALFDWRGRRIEFPAQAEVSRKFGSDHPLVLHEAEELPRAIVGEESGQVASGLTRNIKQKAGEVIVETRFRSARTGIESGLTVIERIQTARTERLFLQQSIANTAQVNTEFDGVIAENFGPGIGKVDVRFRSDPRQARRIPDQGIGKAAIDGDSNDSAGDGVEIYAWNAQGIGSVGAEIGVVGFVVIPGDTHAKFGDQAV